MSDARRWIFDEINKERIRQDKKHGGTRENGDLPDVDPVLMNIEGGCSPERMAENYGVPPAWRARSACDGAVSVKQGTWAHILVEEVAEVVEAAVICSMAELRRELIQVAAVCVAQIEAIDRRMG